MFLKWYDNPFFLANLHLLSIDPPDPDAAGGGTAVEEDLELDPEDDPGLPDTRTEEEQAVDKERPSSARFRNHDEAERGYEELRRSSATRETALERELKSLRQAPAPDTVHLNEDDVARQSMIAECNQKITTEYGRIPVDDSQRGQKFLEIQTRHQTELTEKISKRASSKAYAAEKAADVQGQNADQSLRAALKAEGLHAEGYIELGYDKFYSLSDRDPGWENRMSPDEQFAHLAKLVKQSGVTVHETNKHTRKIEVDAHRKAAFDGSLQDGANVSRETRQTTQAPTGPGSMVDDMKRNRANQKALATAKLKHL